MKTLIYSLIGMLFLSVNIQAQEAEVPENGPKIEFAQEVYDYGEIMVGDDGKCVFEFTNVGNEPLILSKPRSSCGCTVPSWPKEPILPGESSKIDIKYNTSRAGTINKSVTVYSNAVNKASVVLRIKGKVVDKPTEALPEKESSSGAAAPGK